MPDLLRRVLEIIVKGHDVSIARLPDPYQQSVVLAEVSHEPYAANAWILAGRVCNDGPTPVGASVIN